MLLRWLLAVPAILAAVPAALVALPRVLGRALRGFGREVGVVSLGLVRALVSLLPGSRLLLRVPQRRMQAAGAERSRGRVAAPGRRPDLDAPAPRPRSAAEQRAAALQRARLRARLRALTAVLLLVGAVAAWFVVPASDLFRIRHLEVSGTGAVADLDVRDRIDPLLAGRTVFTVEEDELARRIERLPFVRDVRVERHLPGGLQLHVTEYRPLALGVGDGDFWLVAHDGRILAEANRDEWIGRIPTVELREERIRPGDRVGDEPSLRLLAARAPDSAVAFEVVRSDRFTISARLVDGVDVRFGRPVQLLLKVAALERALELAERNGEELRYVDVSVPGKPAICPARDARCSQQRTAQKGGDATSASAAITPEETGGDEPSDAEAVG